MSGTGNCEIEGLLESIRKLSEELTELEKTLASITTDRNSKKKKTNGQPARK